MGGLCRFLLIYSSIHLLEHVLAQFPNLLHFLDFWVCAQQKKRHTFDWAKTYTIKFLEVGGKSKDQCNLKHSPNIKSRGKEPGWNKRIDATQ
jgi:hypothetical protein